MGKKTAIGTVLLVGILATASFLYSHFVGFERPSLTRKLPADTHAALSVRHLRKLGIAFATDEQLQASSQVLQALGKILEKSIPSLDFPGEKPEIHKSLLIELSKHFKTQLTIAAVPTMTGVGSVHESLEFALLTDFYGKEAAFRETLQEITHQAAVSSQIELSWVEASWDSIPYYILSSSLSKIDPELPEIELCWATYKDVLYLATQPRTIEKLLNHANAPGLPNALAALNKHEIEKHLDSPDLTLYVNAPPTLTRLANDLSADLIASGGLAASFSPHTFIETLKLDEIESLAVALELTGNRTAYSGISYKSEIPILDSIQALDRANHSPPKTSPIYAYESFGLNTGKALLELKDAFLRAAPLANFAYLGVRSKLKLDSGLDIEEVLSRSFAPEATTLQLLDFGTSRNQFGEVQEQVVFDTAIRLKLADSPRLQAILNSQITRLLQSTSFRAYREDNILYVDREPDSTLTSKRLALAYDDDFMLLGSGTLKSFHTLRNANAKAPGTYFQQGGNANTIGGGNLVASNLPATLFQISAVLYQQVNNTKNIPTAFVDFDWSSLTILEQHRESTTLHTDGHLYRVSRQTD